MSGLLSRPGEVAAVRAYVPLLRRLRKAGWEHHVTELVVQRGHSWKRGDDKVVLDDVGNLIIRPYLDPEWDVPVLSADQVATVLELAGVLPQEQAAVAQPPAVDRDAVAALVVESLWRAGWRPPPGVARVGDEPPPIWAALVASQPNGSAAAATPGAELLPHRLPLAPVAPEDGWVDLPPGRAMHALANWRNGGREELDAMHAEAVAAQQAEAGEVEAGEAPC